MTEFAELYLCALYLAQEYSYHHRIPTEAEVVISVLWVILAVHPHRTVPTDGVYKTIRSLGYILTSYLPPTPSTSYAPPPYICHTQTSLESTAKGLQYCLQHSTQCVYPITFFAHGTIAHTYFSSSLSSVCVRHIPCP